MTDKPTALTELRAKHLADSMRINARVFRNFPDAAMWGMPKEAENTAVQCEEAAAFLDAFAAQPSADGLAETLRECEAENDSLREALGEASKWLSDVWPLLCPLKEEWVQAGSWSNYDEEVFNRRAELNLKIGELLEILKGQP